MLLLKRLLLSSFLTNLPGIFPWGMDAVCRNRRWTESLARWGEVKETTQEDSDDFSCLHGRNGRFSEVTYHLSSVCAHKYLPMATDWERGLFFPFSSFSCDFNGRSLQESYWQGRLDFRAWVGILFYFLIKIFEVSFIAILCVRMSVHAACACSACRAQRRGLAWSYGWLWAALWG